MINFLYRLRGLKSTYSSTHFGLDLLPTLSKMENWMRMLIVQHLIDKYL